MRACDRCMLPSCTSSSTLAAVAGDVEAGWRSPLIGICNVMTRSSSSEQAFLAAIGPGCVPSHGCYFVLVVVVLHTPSWLPQCQCGKISRGFSCGKSLLWPLCSWPARAACAASGDSSSFLGAETSCLGSAACRLWCLL